MEIIEILGYFWEKLKWFLKKLTRYLMWVVVILTAIGIILYFSPKDFFENRKRKKKGGGR